MRITLFALNGSYAHSNLAIRILRDALEQNGCDGVTLVEGTLRDKKSDLLAQLVATRGDIFGFSCYIWNIEDMKAIAADLKALCPACRIVFGGPEVSYATERFTALDFVDCVLVGEGEDVIVELVRTAEEGEALPRQWIGTPDPRFAERGIHYRENEPVSSLVYYESSRGCPYSCAFCLSSATAGVRAKSAEKTLADLRQFEAFSAPLTVKLVDRTFNFDRARAKAIWRGLLDEGYTKCYHFEICASLLDEESFKILSRFPKGKVRLEIGLQSTNEQTLSAISRHTDAERVLTAAKRLTERGNVHVHLDLIAGLPYEDMSSFRASFDAAYFACDILQLGFLKLLHGTALRRDAEALGIRFSPTSPYTVLKTPWLSYEELCLLQDMADLLDRLCEKGRFARSLPFLLKKLSSPFDFYRGFALYLACETGKKLQKISQRDLFSLLAAYGAGLVAPEDGASFKALLREDFETAEVRRAPQF